MCDFFPPVGIRRSHVCRRAEELSRNHFSVCIELIGEGIGIRVKSGAGESPVDNLSKFFSIAEVELSGVALDLH